MILAPNINAHHYRQRFLPIRPVREQTRVGAPVKGAPSVASGVGIGRVKGWESITSELPELEADSEPADSVRQTRESWSIGLTWPPLRPWPQRSGPWTGKKPVLLLSPAISGLE